MYLNSTTVSNPSLGIPPLVGHTHTHIHARTRTLKQRLVVRRQEMLQMHVEKCEEILSTKAEAKDTLVKEVSDPCPS